MWPAGARTAANGRSGRRLKDRLRRKDPQELNLAVVHAALYVNEKLARVAGGSPIKVLELVARHLLDERHEPSGVWTTKQVDLALDGMRTLVDHQKAGPSTAPKATDQQLRMLSIGVVVVATIICNALADKSGSDAVGELVAASDCIDEATH